VTANVYPSSDDLMKISANGVDLSMMPANSIPNYTTSLIASSSMWGVNHADTHVSHLFPDTAGTGALASPLSKTFGYRIPYNDNLVSNPSVILAP